MAVRKGLGRGLDLLIPKDEGMPKKSTEKNKENKEPKENQVLTLSIHDVEPNRNQPRKQFDEDAIEELADSIKQYGVIQPLIVQKKDKYYEIIAGERRWRAAKKAGLKEIPVVIRDYSDQKIVELSLIENIQREDLNPIEEAQAYQRLVKEYNLKQDEVADRVFKSRAAVTNSMRLLKLDNRVQQMLIDDMISAGHARALLAIEDGDKQYNVAMRIFDEKLSVRDIEKLIKDIASGKDEKKENAIPANDFVYRQYEEKLNSVFGSKVIIHNKDNNKGKIEINYGSREEFERIMELIENGHVK